MQLLQLPMALHAFSGVTGHCSTSAVAAQEPPPEEAEEETRACDVQYEASLSPEHQAQGVREAVVAHAGQEPARPQALSSTQDCSR